MGYKWSKLFPSCYLYHESGFHFCSIEVPLKDHYYLMQIAKKLESYNASYAISDAIKYYQDKDPTIHCLVGFRCEKALMKYLLANNGTKRVTSWKTSLEFRVRLINGDSNEEGICRT